jgi:hypothetical protein
MFGDGDDHPLLDRGAGFAVVVAGQAPPRDPDSPVSTQHSSATSAPARVADQSRSIALRLVLSRMAEDFESGMRPPPGDDRPLAPPRVPCLLAMAVSRPVPLRHRASWAQMQNGL